MPARGGMWLLNSLVLVWCSVSRGGAPAALPSTDRKGDLLPSGAVARLGTVRLRSPGEVASLAFAPDGKTLAARDGLGGNSIRLWDVATGKIRHRFKGTQDDRGIAFSPDGKLLAAGSSFPHGMVILLE